MLQRDTVVGRQEQAGTRAGHQQRHTHRRVTSAHQRRPTTLHNDNQLNKGTTCKVTNPCSTRLRELQPATRLPGASPALAQETTHAALHNTCHQVMPINKQSTAPTEVKVRIIPECTQIGSRGAGGFQPPSARKQAQTPQRRRTRQQGGYRVCYCLLYTSDAADE